MKSELILLPIDISLHIDKKRAMNLDNEIVLQGIKTELLTWLNENIDVWNLNEDVGEFGSFIFLNEEDAMAFKLRWL